MRDCYVGDIGDFANNGLLRVLCGTPQEPVFGMRLGIIWYRNEDEDPRGYGNEIGYLNPSNHNRRTYRECDPDLYADLQRIVGERMARNENRRIEDIINSPMILRCDTQHFADPLPMPATAPARYRWLNNAMGQTAESDVIFLNPDTGITWGVKTSRHHVEPSELMRLLRMNKILVIYQHQQQQNDANWIENNARKLRQPPRQVPYLWACIWRPQPQRAYFIAAGTEEQRARIEECLATLQKIHGQCIGVSRPGKPMGKPA